MRDPVLFIPILTKVLAVFFSAALLGRWREQGGTHRCLLRVGYRYITNRSFGGRHADAPIPAAG